MTPLARASWTIVIVVCVIAAISSFLLGYAGYGFCLLAVGAAASVNLWPRKAAPGPETAPPSTAPSPTPQAPSKSD